jgi:hypothetical protein
LNYFLSQGDFIALGRIRNRIRFFFRGRIRIRIRSKWTGSAHTDCYPSCLRKKCKIFVFKDINHQLNLYYRNFGNRDLSQITRSHVKSSPVISKSKDTCMSILYSRENYVSKGEEKRGTGVPRSEALQSYFCFTLPLLKVKFTFVSLPILFMQHP